MLYKNLLTAPRATVQRLLSQLALGEDTSVAKAVRDRLRESGVVDYGALGLGDVEQQLALVPAPSDAIIPTVASIGLSRAIVDTGDATVSIKVYFDNASHQTKRQRGWVQCGYHGCIRYRFVGNATREVSLRFHAYVVCFIDVAR